MSIFTNLLSTLRIRRAELQREDVTERVSLAELEFLVPNMVCEGCAERITAALMSMSGVREVRSKVPQKRIRVRYEPAKILAPKLKDAVNKSGFTVVDA